jgi:hypothetical protein
MLLLADHVAGSGRVLRAAQRVLELVTVPLLGEHYLRRPMEHVRAAGFRIEGHRPVRGGVRRTTRCPQDGWLNGTSVHLGPLISFPRTGF